MLSANKIVLFSLIGLTVGRYYDRVDTYTLGSQLSIQEVESKTGCASLCDVTVSCQGFCFNSISKLCILHRMVDFGEGTVEVGFTTYLLYQQKVIYSTATNNCKVLGGYLSQPMNAEQNEILNGLHISGGANIYLGSDDIHNEGTFAREDGSKSISYLNWRSNEPNGGVGEQCIVLVTDGLWVDIPCNYEYYYVCQYPEPEADVHVDSSGSNSCYKRNNGRV